MWVEMGLRLRSQCRAHGGSQLACSGLPGLSVHISLVTSFPFRVVLRAAGHLAYSLKINMRLAYSYILYPQKQEGTHGQGPLLPSGGISVLSLAPPGHLCGESTTVHERRACQATGE